MPDMMEPYRRKINYYECDRMGVVHHSCYIRYMEEARIDYLERIGYSFASLEKEGIVSPVVSLSCKYLKPSTFGETLEIEVSVADISAVKLALAYVMSVDGKKVFTAESVHCFIENGRPIRIPERFPLLEEYRA